MKKGKTEGNNSRNENWFFKQSSELELLISAAVVFASFAVAGLVEDMIFSLLNNNVPSNSEWLFLLAIVSLFTSSILPVTIVIHFLLRFYWLSLVGLRSVFNGKPEIKGFSEKFQSSLKKPLDLDRQIDAIDRVCSSIFAFSFMTMFAVILSISSVFIIVLVILPSISGLFDSSLANNIIGIITNLFLLLCLIYMIDFFTLGWFKKIKNKWFIKVYYPIYRFMSAITFSFFYRGIYYSLVLQTSKKFMAILLPIYVFITLFLLNAGYSPSKIYDGIYTFRIDQESFKNQYYADRFEEPINVRIPFIESYEVGSGVNHLKLHVPITAALEDSLLAKCKGISPVNKKRAVNWRKYIQTGLSKANVDENFNLSENARSIIDCFKQSSELVLDDSIRIDPIFRFMQWTKPDRIVFMAVIGLDSTGIGEHNISFRYRNSATDTTIYNIPFWKD